MVSLRTPLRRAVAARVTAYALHLYRLGLKMRHDGVDESSREAINLDLALHRELGLKPWHPTVFDLDAADDTPVDLDDMRGRQHAYVLDLLRQLQALVDVEEPSEPHGRPRDEVRTTISRKTRKHGINRRQGQQTHFVDNAADNNKRS